MKKRYNIPFILVVVLAAFTISSCTDWLTVEPEGQLLKDNFWKTKGDVESAVAAMYNKQQATTSKNLLLGEARSSLMNVSPNASSDLQRIESSNITSTNSYVVWSDYYATINMANTIMYYNKEVFGSDVTFTKELMDQIDAECLFIRALNHFYLVRLWQEVPIMNTPTISDTSTIFVGKSPEKEVIRFIEQDLLKAKDLIPADYNEAGRANKYAIMSLLADVYLWNEQYQLAIDYCDEVTKGGYSLELTENVFDIYYPGNAANESIFEIQYNEALHEERSPIYGIFPINGTDLLLTNPEVVEELFGENIASDIRTYNPISSLMAIPKNKYLLTDLENNNKRTTSEEDANFIYYRYADITLIKAEALWGLKRFTEANEELAKTKVRAGLAHTPILDPVELGDEILAERGREFLGEGKRWFDVLRFAKKNNFANKDLIADIILSGAGNVQDQQIIKAYVYDTLGYFFPVPERDMLFNPKMVQNSFYEK